MRRSERKTAFSSIFCINTGRSGSHYLANLLGTAESAISFHEPKPAMNEHILRLVEEDGLASTTSQRSVKVRAIEELMKNSNSTVYAETSHMFIKTFFDVVCEDLKNVKVVFLQREIVEILKSFVELRYFTEENQVWKNWLTTPLSKNSAIPFVGDPLDSIDLSIGYIVDIHARGEKFVAQYRDIETMFYNITDLNDEATVLKLFERMNLIPTPKTFDALGTVVNTRTKRKQNFNHFADENQLTEKIQNYLGLLNDRKIQVPESLVFGNN